MTACGRFGGRLSAGGGKLGWVLEAFVAAVQPWAGPVPTVPCVLGVGLTQGRLTGAGDGASSFSRLPGAGRSCGRALPSDPKLSGQRVAWGNGTKTQSFLVLRCQAHTGRCSGLQRPPRPGGCGGCAALLTVLALI